jgi:hypothetical protein
MIPSAARNRILMFEDYHAKSGPESSLRRDTMNSEIAYPVILLAKDGVRVGSDSEHLTTTQRSLLSAGLYNDQLMVDSAGRARRLKEAREISSGGGLLSRWSRFWNPSGPIRVELIFDGDLTSISVDELKERLSESFAGRSGNFATWHPGTINFEQLKEGLKTSKTFDEVFRLVREYTTVRPELR